MLKQNPLSTLGDGALGEGYGRAKNGAGGAPPAPGPQTRPASAARRSEREAKLAAALRANLRRRKAAGTNET